MTSNNKKYESNDSPLVVDIKKWNVDFPFDLIWRRKYNIPFMSDTHKKMCLFDIKFDVTEDKLIQQIIAENEINTKLKEMGKKPDEQLFKNSVVVKNNKEQQLKDFEDLDLETLNL